MSHLLQVLGLSCPVQKSLRTRDNLTLTMIKYNIKVSSSMVLATLEVFESHYWPLQPNWTAL